MALTSQSEKNVPAPPNTVSAAGEQGYGTVIMMQGIMRGPAPGGETRLIDMHRPQSKSPTRGNCCSVDGGIRTQRLRARSREGLTQRR